jgi:hypothetical protein
MRMRNIYLISMLFAVSCANLERDTQETGLPTPPVEDVDPEVIDPTPEVTPDAAPPLTPDACGSHCEGTCADDLECGPDDKCDNGKCYQRCECDEDCTGDKSKCIWGLCKPV